MNDTLEIAVLPLEGARGSRAPVALDATAPGLNPRDQATLKQILAGKADFVDSKIFHQAGA